MARTAKATAPKAASSRPPTSSTVKPPSAAVAAAAGTLATPRPPLEKALDSFGKELRAALDRGTTEAAALRAEVKALRAELDALRQRHAAHTHSYTSTQMGGGGHHWIELRFLQAYLDGEHPGLSQHGFWVHGHSTSDGPAEKPTSGPSV